MKMIRTVYIMSSESGLCIMEKEYMSVNQDPHLLSSFLMALMQFGQEMSSGGIVKTIEFGDHNIIISSGEKVIVACIVDKTDSEQITMESLTFIRNSFIDTYGHIINEWAGDMSIFAGFSDIIDECTKNGMIAIQDIKIPFLKCKISETLVRMGQISKSMYEVAILCNGSLTPEDIATQVGINTKEIYSILSSLENLNMLDWVQP